MKKVILLLTVFVLILQAGCARIEEGAPASDVLVEGETDELIPETAVEQEKDAPVAKESASEKDAEAEPEPKKETKESVSDETQSKNEKKRKFDIREIDLVKEKVSIVLAEKTPKIIPTKYPDITAELWIKEVYYGSLKVRDKVHYKFSSVFHSGNLKENTEYLIAMREATDPQSGKVYYIPLWENSDYMDSAWNVKDRKTAKDEADTWPLAGLYDSIFELYVDQKTEPSSEMRFLKNLEKYPEFYEKIRNECFIVVRVKALDKGEPIVMKNNDAYSDYSESTRMHLEIQEVYYGPVQKGEIIDYWETLGVYQDYDLVMENLGRGEKPLEVGKEYLMVAGAHYAEENGEAKNFYQEFNSLAPNSYVNVEDLPAITDRINKEKANVYDRFFYDLVN